MTSPLPILKPMFKPLNKKDSEMKVAEICADKSKGIPPTFICTENICDCNGHIIDVECGISENFQEAMKDCCKKAIAARKDIAARKEIK